MNAKPARLHIRLGVNDAGVVPEAFLFGMIIQTDNNTHTERDQVTDCVIVASKECWCLLM